MLVNVCEWIIGPLSDIRFPFFHSLVLFYTSIKLLMTPNMQANLGMLTDNLFHLPFCLSIRNDKKYEELIDLSK